MEINKILTNTAKTCVFTTENKPIKVKAYYIDAPTICFRSRGGVRRENATTFGGKVWKDVDAFWYNKRSIYNKNDNNNSNSNGKPIEWAICYDINSRGGDQSSRAFVNLLQQFIRGRNFDIQYF
eukprot:168799_1